MNLFFHEVGKKGADEDFPKTIFNTVNLETIQKLIPSEVGSEAIKYLKKVFPMRKFNVWGVPSGASPIIKQLSVGDSMFLIRTISGNGEIPVLCNVKAFWKTEMRQVSQALWGSDRFPYIFFCTIERIDLSWTDFKKYVGYKPNFRPSGNVYPILENRLVDFGGVQGFINFVRQKHEHQLGNIILDGEITPTIEYEEGQRMVRERSFFVRNKKLVKEAKKHYGYICQACNFDFEKMYGVLGKDYIECHHIKPLFEYSASVSTIEDVRVVCSNCHRMLHRNKIALTVEELRVIISQLNRI